MKDQFANYVVQKVLETCDDQQLELILNRIKVHLNALKKYTYGKHIVARVEKLVAAGGTFNLINLLFHLTRRLHFLQFSQHGFFIVYSWNQYAMIWFPFLKCCMFNFNLIAEFPLNSSMVSLDIFHKLFVYIEKQKLKKRFPFHWTMKFDYLLFYSQLASWCGIICQSGNV